jgi:hypothetical protein
MIGGTLDGLNRVTRMAESYWHVHSNIDPKVAGKYTVELIKGMNHLDPISDTSFIPQYAKKHDLKSETTKAEVRAQLVQLFTSQILSLQSGSSVQSSTFTSDFMKPLVWGLEQEGNYQTKPPCYDSAEINPIKPTCTAGSPWITNYAHKQMAGQLKNPNVGVAGNDNFHRTDSVYPYHHPEFNGDCSKASANQLCTIESISITENKYNGLTDFTKLERFMVAAFQQETKLKSRQAFKHQSGESDASYEANDKGQNRCQEVNQISLDLAIKMTDAETL